MRGLLAPAILRMLPALNYHLGAAGLLCRESSYCSSRDCQKGSLPFSTRGTTRTPSVAARAGHRRLLRWRSPRIAMLFRSPTALNEPPPRFALLGPVAAPHPWSCATGNMGYVFYREHGLHFWSVSSSFLLSSGRAKTMSSPSPEAEWSMASKRLFAAS